MNQLQLLSKLTTSATRTRIRLGKLGERAAFTEIRWAFAENGGLNPEVFTLMIQQVADSPITETVCRERCYDLLSQFSRLSMSQLNFAKQGLAKIQASIDCGYEELKQL